MSSYEEHDINDGIQWGCLIEVGAIVVIALIYKIGMYLVTSI